MRYFRQLLNVLKRSNAMVFLNWWPCDVTRPKAAFHMGSVGLQLSQVGPQLGPSWAHLGMLLGALACPAPHFEESFVFVLFSASHKQLGKACLFGPLSF